MADLKTGDEAGKAKSGPMSLSADESAAAAQPKTADPAATQASTQPSSQTPAQAEQVAAAPAGGSYLLHLASYKNPKNADAGWLNLKGRFSNLLSGLSPVVKLADLGTKGVYHRLYAGPVANEGEAKKICAAFKKRGTYCKPAKP